MGGMSLIRLYSADKFIYAGQNIAATGNSNKFPDTADGIRSMVNQWFAEYKNVNASVINSFVSANLTR